MKLAWIAAAFLLAAGSAEAQTIYVPGQGAPGVILPPILQALSLSPLTATAGSLWTGSIGNKTAASTISATSSDGTSLTVSGSAVTGTFPAAGTPTISLTETLAGAIGSPRLTAINLTVNAASQSAQFFNTDGSNLIAIGTLF